MELNKLKKMVVQANKELLERRVVLYSWGNVSQIDREKGFIVIKPAGLPYHSLNVDNISVTDLNGNRLSGPHKPSVDIMIHVEIFKNFTEVQAIAHTHSTYATMWAQAQMSIPAMGTTHGDYFDGPIPCARPVTESEVDSGYEQAIGRTIVEAFADINPRYLPAVLAAQHGVFTWGDDCWQAVHNCVVLEEIAKMAWGTLALKPNAGSLLSYIGRKHFDRKHGPDAYFDIDDMGAPENRKTDD